MRRRQRHRKNAVSQLCSIYGDDLTQDVSEGSSRFDAKLVRSHCLTLNGTDQNHHANVQGASAIDFTGTNKAKLTMWVYPNATSTGFVYLGSSSQGFYPCFTGNKFYVRLGTGSNWIIITGSVLVGQWNKIEIETLDFDGYFTTSNDIRQNVYLNDVLEISKQNGDDKYVSLVSNRLLNLDALGEGGSYHNSSFSNFYFEIGDKDDWENTKQLIDFWPFAEGDGGRNYNVGLRGGYVDVTNPTASLWTTFQDLFHYNALIGFNEVSGVKIPAKLNNPYQDVLGNTITNPSFGRKWNFSESKLQINPTNAAALTALGFDDTHLEDFVDPLPANMQRLANGEILIK